jgi:hypothetical protein
MQIASNSRARLASLSQGSYITDASLAAVLKELKTNPDCFPEHASRHTIKRARDEQVKVETTHGPLMAHMSLQLIDPPETRKVCYISPAAILQHACSVSKNSGSLLKSAMQKTNPSPTTPMRICIYSDEVAPGNVMKHDNKRRVQCIYWALIDTGPLALMDEDNWFLLAAVRSSVVNRLPGGMGQLMEDMINCFFEAGASFEDGLLVHTHDGPAFVFAEIITKLGDESALKMCFDVKGASGTLMCMLCRNITAHGSELEAHDKKKFFLASTCTDTTRFVPQSDQTVADAVAMIRANVGVGTKASFARMQQAVGINYAPLGVLFSHRLVGKVSMVGSVMFDWMHVYMSSGIFGVEVGLLLGKLAQAGISNVFVHNQVQAYTWPRRLSSRGATGKSTFQRRTGTASSELKCTASKGLSTFRVFRSIIWTTILPQADSELVQAIRCYFALCKVIELLLAVPRGGVDHNILRKHICLHLNMFLATYAAENWFPKCHYAIHLPDHLQSKGTLLSCWTHERKHKQIKKFANELDNTSLNFEQNIMVHQLFSQIESLKNKPALAADASHLVLPKLAPSKLASVVCQIIQQPSEVFTSIEAKVGVFMQSCFKGDVVMFLLDTVACVGEVWFHVNAIEHCLTCVSLWQKVKDHEYKVQERLIFLPSVNIQHVCTYKRQADTIYIVPE